LATTVNRVGLADATAGVDSSDPGSRAEASGSSASTRRLRSSARLAP